MDFKAPDDWVAMVDDDAQRNPAWLSRYELHGVPLGSDSATIFNSHAIGKRVPVDSLTFFLDGSPISGDQTPEDLGLEPGDRIDCERA